MKKTGRIIALACVCWVAWSYAAWALLPQTVTFTPDSPQTYNTTNNLSSHASAPGSGAWTFWVESGPGQIVSQTNLWVTSGINTVKVWAAIAADLIYNAASNSAYVGAQKADQTITNFIPTNGSAFATTSTVGLAAQASSGLSVTNFTVISGPGVISGLTNLTFTNSGTVSVTAYQAGNSNWNSAPTVTNTFNVTKATALVTLNNLTQTYDGNAKTVTAPTAPTGLTVAITYNGNSWAPTNVGSYAVTGVVNEAMYQGSTNGTLTVNKKELTVINAVATNKVYDGTTAAIISGAELSGVVAGDTVNLGNDTSGTFADKNVGTGKAVTTAMTISGADASNYTLTQPSLTANITVRTLNLTNFTADNKVYDGTTAVTGTGFNDDRVGGDGLSFTYNAAFADANVGTGKAVNYTAITISGGADQDNYMLAATTGATTADITKASRTVTFSPTSPQTYNTTNGLSATASAGTGLWTFAVQSGSGQIVGDTNLWMGAAYGTVTVRATIENDDNYNNASDDADVTAQATSDGGGTNSIPWYDNFAEADYMHGTPLVNIKGWYASDSSCIVQTNVKHTGTQAAMIPVDVTLSNRFDNAYHRVVRMEMFIQPQLYNGVNYPEISTNIAVQFFVNSNGYFVVGNGTNQREITNMASGAAAIPITNTYFTRIQLNLRYKNHTWNLKAWSNETLMASTYYVNFTSNLNTFGGFDIYNGNAINYVDDVSVTNVDVNLLPKINGVPVDIIKSINGAPPTMVNGIRMDR